MTDPTNEQVSEEENSAEEVELSKDTLEDLDASEESAEDAKGGAIKTYECSL